MPSATGRSAGSGPGAVVACGEISLGEAKQLVTVATEDTEEAWLRTLPWFTGPDIRRMVELASRGVPILTEADRVVDMLMPDLRLTDRVTFGGLRRQMPAPRHAV